MEKMEPPFPSDELDGRIWGDPDEMHRCVNCGSPWFNMVTQYAVPQRQPMLYGDCKCMVRGERSAMVCANCGLKLDYGLLKQGENWWVQSEELPDTIPPLSHAPIEASRDELAVVD